MKKFLIFLIIGLILLNGCIQTQTEEVIKYKFVCPDDSIVEDSKDCPKVEPEIIIKYQCLDGSYADKKYECPEPEKEIVYIKDYSEDDDTSSQSSFTGTFTGSGSEVTDEFYLKSGIVIIEGTHSGSSNFAVKLISRELEYPYNEHLIFNEIGDYSGTTTENLYDSAKYFLNIEADGNWEIEIK